MAQQYPPYPPQSTVTDPQLAALHLPPVNHANLYPPPPSHDVHGFTSEPYRPPPPQAAQMMEPMHMQQQSNDIQQQTPNSARKEGSARGNNRLRKACDSCSIRKVKCDEAGPPCRACAALDIPCTYERPSRRRGPPNKHAENIKRQRMESSQQGSPMAMPSSPALPSVNLAATQAPSGLDAESIAPIELINAFVEDYFTYVHPLTPFPHEPSFREAWRLRKDRDDRFFLALLAGMVGGMVSIFPRRPRRHLKAMGKDKLFPTSTSLVDRCRAVCLEARGAGYLERIGLYVYDAATSYFLVIMSSFMYRWQSADMYLGECFTIIRASGFSRPLPPYPPVEMGARAALTTEEEMNFIDEEVGRRIFWTVYVTARSSRAFGAQLADLPILPPTSAQGYPPMPLEVDDQYIYATHFERQPHNVVSKMAGFNANVRVYLIYNTLLAMEASYSVDHVFDWEKQKRVLKGCYENVKHSLDEAPEVLLVWPAHASRSPSSTSVKTDNHTPANMLTPQAQMIYQSALQNSTEECRQIAYEIQKANIHVSVLSSRSFFLEKYWALCQQYPAPAAASQRQQSAGPSQPASSSPSAFAYRNLAQAASDSVLVASYENEMNEVRTERESIARDLLDVLSKIRPIHMEPNSVSFCMKIRQIAATLLPLEGDVSRLQDDGLAAKYLRPVLDILMEVEKSGQPSQHEDTDEEAELRRWTGLRDYQKELLARQRNGTGAYGLF